MTSARTIPEIYREAARIIEEEGWIKGDYYKKGQGYCVVGAVRKACGFDPGALMSLPDRIVEPMCDYVCRKTGRSDFGFIAFNDMSPDANPVIKMLNEIADRMEKEQAK